MSKLELDTIDRLVLSGGGRLRLMQPSQIREVHNLGVRLRAEDPEFSHCALHFGEPDLGTPAFIIDAGCRALRNGAVFYENNAGRPDLRQALAQHHALAAENFVLTCGGTQAICLTFLALLSPGDDAIAITPSWPNLAEAARLAGARVHEVALRFDEEEKCFGLDFERLEQAVRAASNPVMLIVNSPSNPTGWTVTCEEQEQLLAICRAHGLFLISDEIYDRIVFRAEPFASASRFLSEWPHLVVINGFSKAYAMTGWRIGYLISTPGLAAGFARMQEFITSHAPSMAQVAAIAALHDGEDFVAASLRRYRSLRNTVVSRLATIPGVTVARPDGTFYVFFRVDEVVDSMAFCVELLTATGVSLAPGSAFGAGGNGWLRLCFANQSEVLDSAIDRLESFLLSRWRTSHTDTT